MANFRIIHDNAADRAVLGVSSSASAALGAANLKTDRKGEIWRASATQGTITATWASAETLGGVMLPYTNLGPGSTIRVKGYTNAGDALPAYDSGAVLGCPPLPADQPDTRAQAAGVNSYAYTGAACARLWFPNITVRKLEVIVSDPTNPSGYIEIGRLVCGRYWEGQKNADYGAGVTPVDRTELVRNDGGDLVPDIGTQHRKLTFALSNLTRPDRNVLWNVLAGNGKRVPIFVSLFPEDADVGLEQQHQLYGRLVTSPAMSMPSFLQYASSLEIEEI